MAAERKIWRNKKVLDKWVAHDYNKFCCIETALNVLWIEPGTSEGGKSSMSEIHVKENESLESALKRFKRSCAKAGVIQEVKKREHYVSPSLKRKQKSEAARKNKKRFY